MTFLVPGLDVEEKGRVALEALWRAVGGQDRFGATDVRWLRSDRGDPSSNEEAVAQLQVTVKDRDAEKVGRAFSRAAVELGLATYPGFAMTGPPGDSEPYAVYWPASVPAETVEQRVVLDGGSMLAALPAWPPPPAQPLPSPARESWIGPTRRAPLGTVAGARSGDKGGNANLGVWGRTADWLPLAGGVPHRRPVARPDAGDRRSGGRAARLPQHRRSELRHPWVARRWRRLVNPARPAGEDARGVPAGQGGGGSRVVAGLLGPGSSDVSPAAYH